MSDTYYARICWNSAGWEFPTGKASDLEDKTYVAIDRYGHEEWLFNYTWGLEDGYQYAFLQGVNQSFKKLSGQTINVLLWSINPDRRRVRVGRIVDCEVLTDAERRATYKRYEEAGWLKLMKEDVDNVKGETSSLSIDVSFNIRFKPSKATRYDNPYPLISKTNRVSSLKRYTLVQALASDNSTDWINDPEGKSEPLSIESYLRKGSAGGTANRRHAVLQNELLSLLQAEYGSDRVTLEAAWVDLTIVDGKRKMLLEIKPYSSARHAVREAFGQILEYGFYKTASNVERLELFIVAPGPLDEQLSAYLNLLRDTFRLPLRYVQFSKGCPLPQALKKT